tara:strand:+ start:1523 stop:1951 length:429 start_codon:yes stop_codon:yes gene_type:complete
MPDLLPKSTVSALKNAPPRSATSDRRLEASPTRTFSLSLNFFPEFFAELERNFIFPGVFRRMQLNNAVIFRMENNFKAYQKGGEIKPVEIGAEDAKAVLLLVENPSLYREDSGIQSVAELKQKLADASGGQAGPGTSRKRTG